MTCMDVCFLNIGHTHEINNAEKYTQHNIKGKQKKMPNSEGMIPCLY